MKSTVIIVTLAVALCLVCSSIWAQEESPAKHQQTALVVDLRDGSHLMGSAAIRVLPIHTQVSGKLEVRLKTVELIEFSDDRELAKISFRNGDRLTGIIDLDALKLQTLLGKVSLPMGEMVRIKQVPFTVEPSLARGSALRFAGGDKVYIADAPIFELQDLTLQALIKVQGPEIAGPHSRVIVFRGDSRMNNDPYYLAITAQGYLYAGVDVESGEKFYAEAREQVKLDEWLQVTGTYDSKERRLRLYVNGELRAELPTTGDPLKVLIGADPALAIGNFPPRVWQQMFVGLIDEVRIWNRALSQAQIRGNMRIKLSGREPGLVAYWDFDEGEGQVVHDLTGNGNHGCLGNTTATEPDDPRWAVSDAPVKYPRKEKSAAEARKLKKIEAELARNKGPAIRVVVELVDGSNIVGTSSLGVVPIRTKWAGNVDVALKAIASLELEDDHEQVRASLRNGDTLKGVIGLPGIKLRTAFGDVVIPIEYVVRIRNPAVETRLLVSELPEIQPHGGGVDIPSDPKERLLAMQPNSGDALLRIIADPGNPLNRRATNALLQIWESLTPRQIDAYFKAAIELKTELRPEYPQKVKAMIGAQYNVIHGWGWPPDVGRKQMRTHTRHFLDGENVGQNFDNVASGAYTHWFKLENLGLGEHFIHWTTDYRISYEGRTYSGAAISKKYRFKIVPEDTPDHLAAPKDAEIDRLVRESLVIRETESLPPLGPRLLREEDVDPWPPQINWWTRDGSESGSIHVPVWKLTRELPVDLCFEVELHLVESGEIHKGDGMVVLKGKKLQGYFSPGNSRELARGKDGFIAFRIVLKPSRAIALTNPRVTRYYTGTITSEVVRAKVTK